MPRMTTGDTVDAVIDGTVRTLTFEERQYYEPSNYCYEEGSWCVSDEDDRLYFVSEDGRVDLHDADTFACIRESAGLTQEAHDAYYAQYGGDQFDAMKVVLDFIGAADPTPARQKALDSFNLILNSWNIETDDDDEDDGESQ